MHLRRLYLTKRGLLALQRKELVRPIADADSDHLVHPSDNCAKAADVAVSLQENAFQDQQVLYRIARATWCGVGSYTCLPHACRRFDALCLDLDTGKLCCVLWAVLCRAGLCCAGCAVLAVLCWLCCAVLLQLHVAHIGIVPNILPCQQQHWVGCCCPAIIQGSPGQCVQKLQHVAAMNVGHHCPSSSYASCAVTCILSVPTCTSESCAADEMVTRKDTKDNAARQLHEEKLETSLLMCCGCRFCQYANLPWSWFMPIPTCQSWSPFWTPWQPITGTPVTQMWHQLLLPWWLNGETLMCIPTTFTILCLH